MSAPTQDVTWDSNSTHVTPTLSAHKTDGWGVDEVPTSDELNYWMAGVGAWINYIKGLTGTLTLLVPLFNAGGSAIGPGITQPPIAHNGAALLSYGPISGLHVGNKITAIRTRLQEAGSAGIAAWVTITSYATGGLGAQGNRVTHAGNVYVCTVTGVSGASGPTGTGTGIVDGSVHWDYVCAVGSAGDGVVTVNLIGFTDGSPAVLASKQSNNATDAATHDVSLTGLAITTVTGTNYYIGMGNAGVCADQQTLWTCEIDVVLLP